MYGGNGQQKGTGLADLRGVDPMDRRLEVEKKERYARELRDQMAGNASPMPPLRSSRGVVDDAPAPSGPRPGSGLTGAGAAMLRGDPHLTRLPPTGREDQMIGSFRPELPPPPSPAPSSMYEAGKAESWGTAGKVSQLQDMMRDRLKYLEEQQSLQWERLQQMLNGLGETNNKAVAAAQDAVETAMQRQLHDVVAAAKADISKELERDIQQAVQRAQEHAQQQQEMQLSGLRDSIQRDQQGQLQTLQQGMQQQLEQLRSEGETRHSSLERRVQRLEELVDKAQHRLEGQAGDAASARGEWGDIRRMLTEHSADLQRLERVKADRSELDDRCRELQRDQDELRRAVNSKPRERSPPPPKPAPPPPPKADPEPSQAFKKAPKEAFVILKNGDEETYYLCSLQNVIGRSASCSVVIDKSQGVSNQHASIEVSSGGAVIRDMASRNGLWLNDRRVGPNERLVMESGDSIQLGVDGPSYMFEWGPAALKILPRDYQGLHRRAS